MMISFGSFSTRYNDDDTRYNDDDDDDDDDDDESLPVLVSIWPCTY